MYEVRSKLISFWNTSSSRHPPTARTMRSYTPCCSVILCAALSSGIAIVQGFAPAASSTSTTTVRTAPPTTLQSSTSNDPQLSRRQIGELSIAAIGLTTSYLGTRENTPQDYGLWGVLPVGPYKRKKTIMDTIVPDNIWCVFIIYLSLPCK